MTPLWTAIDLAEATGGTVSRPFNATGVSIDTRTLVPGDLFVALVGEGRDGHDFVLDAMAKGAAGALVHRPVSGADRTLLVDDTLAALARMGGFARSRFEGEVIAITGSVGKTTTKEMVRTILSAFGPTHAAVASYNNHWGLPLTLARTPLDARFCVVEIGMNHPGEIAPLARLARPHVAVITTIEKAHIGHMGSIEAIADEKAAILTGLEPEGVAILPIDNALYPRLRVAAGAHRVVTFGAAPGTAQEAAQGADIRLTGLEQDADGSLIEAEIAGRPIRFRLNAPGRHMAMNALAALAATSTVLAGADRAAIAEQAAAALEAFAPLSGRGARRRIDLPAGTALLLDESYNGNAASMRAALEVLRLQPATRRIAVLGDMRELGDEGPAEHAGLAPDVIRSADLVFTCGPLMRGLHDAIPADLRAAHAEVSTDLAAMVASTLAPGEAILVKGSLGTRMKPIVDAIDALTTPPSPTTGAA
jgi:UDP-N-acetylmuramoyl-tripeptide--D-alanyl-D-alanine ligase